MLENTDRIRTVVRLLDIFIIANFAFLALDVFIAHAVNAFARAVEWLPCVFSLLAALLLVVTLFGNRARIARVVVGWSAVVIGIVGMLLHLHSSFFIDLTLRSLVYAAPFVAPLAFTGLGLLLLMTASTDRQSIAWGQWVVFLAVCGWVGNFALSVLDHAQNGFFNSLEWLPVYSSAFMIGALLMVVIKPWQRHGFCCILLGVNALFGMLGFALHLFANLQRPSTFLENFLYGAPLFAPLLFTNLALLAALGMWQLRRVQEGARLEDTDGDGVSLARCS